VSLGELEDMFVPMESKTFQDPLEVSRPRSWQEQTATESREAVREHTRA